jgi:hypothetical protein
MNFASGGRELRGVMFSMLETHIMMSSLMFRLSLILVFCLARALVLLLALFHVLCLSLRIYSIMIKNSKTEENRHHDEEIYIKLEGNYSRISKGNC